MKNQDPKDIKGVLNFFALKNKEYDNHLIIAKVKDFLDKKFGENASHYTGEILFSSGNLIIRIKSDAWRSTLNMQRNDIKNELNFYLNTEKIVNLYFL